MSSSSKSGAKKRSKAHSNDSHYRVLPSKRPRNIDHTQKLPNEILTHIFSFVSHQDLDSNVRYVCKRWNEVASNPILWKKLIIPDDVPTNVIYRWLKNAPLLKELRLRERMDIDAILHVSSKFTRKLEILSVVNKNGTPLIASRTLCKLLVNCNYLHVVNFEGVNIYSCKFFKLLSLKKEYSRFMYCGPLNPKQVQMLLSSCGIDKAYTTISFFRGEKKIEYFPAADLVPSFDSIMDLVNHVIEQP